MFLRSVQFCSLISSLAVVGCSAANPGPSKTSVKLGVAKGLESSFLGLDSRNLAADASAQLLNFVTGFPVAEWTIKIDGCQSDYSTVATSSADGRIESVPLFSLDEGCQAGLERFGWQGRMYEKVGGGVLSGESGSVAKFADVQSGDELSVVLETQLSSPITDASKAEFLFFTSDLGNSSRFGKGIDVVTKVGGVEPPNFEIFSAGYTNLAGGVPDWVLSFECQAAVRDGFCPTSSGAEHAMSAMSVRIVPDTFNGQPRYQDAEAVFGAGDASQAVIDTSVGSRGGFVTQARGPGKLFAQRNLMVFIRFSRGAGASYRAFNFDIDPPGTQR